MEPRINVLEMRVLLAVDESAQGSPLGLAPLEAVYKAIPEVNRASIRTALKRLVGRGLITSPLRAGYMISPKGAEYIKNFKNEMDELRNATEKT